MPAQLTPVRSGSPVATARSTAACTDASSATSVRANSPPISSAICLPRSSFRSAMTTVAPAAASTRAVASPRPLAPPEMTAEVPLSSMRGASPPRFPRHMGPADSGGSLPNPRGDEPAAGRDTRPVRIEIYLYPSALVIYPRSHDQAAREPVGGPGCGVTRVLHDAARPDDRQHRDPRHDQQAARLPGRRAVGAQRLRAGARRPGDHGGATRRPDPGAHHG